MSLDLRIHPNRPSHVLPTCFAQVVDVQANIRLGTAVNREELDRLIEEAIANGRSFRVTFTNTFQVGPAN